MSCPIETTGTLKVKRTGVILKKIKFGGNVGNVRPVD
jgi:hypothetical protein